MKQKPGKDIFVFGSARLGSALLNAGLIDEIRVIINPILLGAGTRLFQNIERKIDLKLNRSKTFRSGNVLLDYAVSNKV